LVSVAIFDGKQEGLYAAHDPHAQLAAGYALECGIVCSFTPFDVFVLLRQWPGLEQAILRALLEDRVHDTATREKLLDIAAGHRYRAGGYSLAAMLSRRFDHDMAKGEDTWRKRYGELLRLEITAWPAEAREYALEDVRWTWRLWADQEQRRGLMGGDLLEDETRKVRTHAALYAQTLRGVLTDQPYVTKLRESLDQKIHDTGNTLALLGLARWQGKARPKLSQNTKAAQSLMARFCEQHRVPVPKTPTGVALSEDAMRAAGVPGPERDENGNEIIGTGHPLTIFRQRKSLRTQRSRLVPVLQRPIVRTRYDELVDTGRTSSSAPDEPWAGTNFQNLPTSGGYRECLVPPPGEAFVISDWSGAELVTLAQVQLDVLGRSTLGEILISGRNPHTEFACRLMDIPSDQYDPKNPQHLKIRRIAKAWNFGRPGGMGDAAFQRQLRRGGIEMPIDEVRRNNEIWHETLPEMRLYFDWIKSQPWRLKILKDGREIKTYTIRQVRSNRIRGGCTFTEAANTMFQGLAADAAGTALWWLWLDSRNPDSPLWRGEHVTSQVLFVHDEPVSSVPIDRAEAAQARQERIMIEAFRHWCPDVPITVESRIAERYGK